MKKLLAYVVMLLILASLSCDRVRPERPKETSLDSLLPLPLSTLFIPIHYEVNQLEETVNARVQGTFIREWVTNDKGDSLYIEITKRDLIQMSWKKNTLHYSFPIKVSGKFIKSVARIRMKNAKPINMEVVLHLATKLDFDSQWNLVPHSNLEEIEWVKDPKLKLLLFKINIRKFVDGAIEKNKDKLIPKLDEALSRILKTRNTIVKLWSDIQKPIRVNKKEAQVWLKAYASDIHAKLDDNEPGEITLNVELKAWVQLIIDGQKIPPSNDALPTYKKKKHYTDSLQIFVLAQVPYKKVNEILKRELKGKELTAEGYSTTIKNISIYGTDQGLAVDVKVSGDVNGRVFMRGDLNYDSLNSIISAKDFHFDIDSENILVNSADWLLHNNAIGLITEKLQLEVKPYADLLPQLIVNGIERGKSGEKLDLTITNLVLAPVQHIYTKNDIQFLFEAHGRADIGLEKKVFARKSKRKSVKNRF